MPIRAATLDDLLALQPLLRAYCDFYDANPSDDGLLAMARGAIELPDDEAFILAATADDGDEPIGFAACWWKWSSLNGARILFLDDLYVAPDHRGAGHADALIAAIAERGRAGGAPVVAWLTQETNKRARAVYDRVGGTFEPLLEYELKL